MSKADYDSFVKTGKVGQVGLRHETRHQHNNTGKYANTVTAKELRHIKSNWSRFKDSVTFYESGATISTPW